MIVALHSPVTVELFEVDGTQARNLRPEAVAFLRLLPPRQLDALARGDDALARAVACAFLSSLSLSPTPPARP